MYNGQVGPEQLVATRSALQRVAVHVLARRRAAATGRIGLRVTPGGLSTPAFGPGPEVVRMAGPVLVHEIASERADRTMIGATLRELADFVGVDLQAPLDAGGDTPPVGDAEAALELDGPAIESLARWWHVGWRVLDEVAASLPPGSAATTIQVWPEHFDVATTLTLPSGVKLNLGFSPGDGYSAQPYAYVGPWEVDRPGDPDYWNAPFGAVLRADDVPGDDALARAACRQFVERGLSFLGQPGS